MTKSYIQCLRTYSEFVRIRDEWNAFLTECFPGNYGRTHEWLSAVWNTYHRNREALILIQREHQHGSITAAAPLLIKRQMFGGFPVRLLQTLGMGIGSDDLLSGAESGSFVNNVFSHLAKIRGWDVATFHRLRSDSCYSDILRACHDFKCQPEVVESYDYGIDFPENYEAYLDSRSRKFRRNLNQAVNRLEKEGTVTLETLCPFADAGRVAALGTKVAQTTWQYGEGKSHFNDHGAGSFYFNLAAQGRGAGGEEFMLLKAGQQSIAYLLGCRRDRTYHAIDTGFHRDYRHVSAGRILYAMLFNRLIDEQHMQHFDFEGDGSYKDEYSTNSRRVRHVLIYNNSAYALLIRHIRRTHWYSRFRARRQSASQVNG
jgi:CelD/BcsL family acetyltransferase involved in cellulose biosynthesis